MRIITDLRIEEMQTTKILGKADEARTKARWARAARRGRPRWRGRNRQGGKERTGITGNSK
jgi:hypothetical protein